ncbi:MAG: hypothetical protein H6907_11540 [Hyphomicrobiales bacterium]|nr:hypothetical protein [Hyphomicrobiales bacterium]MCP5372355.1 hypothetical protein [Hyphomicrobiales bacterium]
MADHITIGDTPPRVQYAANGTQTDFTYPFPVFDETDLRAYVDDALQTLATHYTVAGAGYSAGGTVTFLAAPADGAVVTLVRRIVIQRTTDFQESGEFRAKVINDELDKRVAVEQQLADGLDRSLKLPETDPAGNLTLPPQADRAGRTLAFDAGSGDPVAGPTADDVANAAAYAAQIVADKAAIESLLSDLGVPAVPSFAHDIDGTDVSNGYVDLAGFDPAHQANVGCAVDGVVQEPALDFTATEVGGTWRLTWCGTSGFAPVEGQRLHVWRRGGAYSSEGGGGAAVWGAVTGTLADQTDLQAALDGKAAGAHSHTESDISDLGAYEPAFAKNTAFNKDFAGSGAAATVARSDHDHGGVYATAGHDHDGAYAALGHGHALDDLSDVDLAAQADGKVLKFNNTSGKWEAQDDLTGGGGANAWTNLTDGTTTAQPGSTSDTFKFRSSDGTVGVAVQSNDATHGDNLDLTLAAASTDLSDSADLVRNTATQDLNDNVVKRAVLQDCHRKVQSPTVTGTMVLDLADGNIVDITRSANITDLTFTGFLSGEESQLLLYLRQGSGTVDWTDVDKWVGGAAPTLGATAGDIDLVVITSPDGGTTKIGTHVGTAS